MALIGRWQSTYEASQPWVVYHFGATHDRWWPPWSSTRILGRAKVGMECAVCGAVETAALKAPRFWGKVVEPASGRHPVREQFLARHAHPDRGAPMSWAKPLLNPDVHDGGVSLDGLTMRLQADLLSEEWRP